MSLWSNVGKSGDLRGHAGNKLRFGLFLLSDHHSPVCLMINYASYFFRISSLFSIVSLCTIRSGYIVDLGVSCSPKSSLLLHPHRSTYSLINFPFPSLNSIVPSLKVTCSFSLAPSCVPRSLLTARRPNSHCILSPFELAKTLGWSPVFRHNRADVLTPRQPPS